MSIIYVIMINIWYMIMFLDKLIIITNINDIKNVVVI